MYPYLVRLGTLSIHTYGVLMVAGFLAAMGLTARAARQWPTSRALRPGEVAEWGSAAMLASILGGRLWYVAQYWDVFRRQVWEIPAIWHGGLVWYGGFLGGVLGTVVYAQLRGRSFAEILDQVIPFGVLGHAIGRVGCFFNGCCYGEPTTAWFGVVFPQFPEESRVPTQLIEAAGLVVLALLLRCLQTPARLARSGRVFAVYVFGYAVLRFVVEFTRGDQVIYWGPLTVPQAVSLVSGSAAAVWLVLEWAQHRSQLRVRPQSGEGVRPQSGRGV